ncbi:MAG: amidohydrolase family protein [Pseudomonadales bacterium]|jgi:predicted TIM-barrel fold metal-dependent hydrolase|nr:amidohydrolase family protein [Pseudomonadales bacterium]MDP6470158.1 amidohydrolase family protein [Pseudomonadales bacterium]MDP6827064.1 amidohydrolase family protein [Pseudomonadales bacterium]|tara:strand:- start:8100 stop:9155 length:1056 start_codon:yes stop_codon:yes gene_type:complete
MRIDCDTHVLEPADLWLNYLEPKYRDRAIRIEENDGIEQLVIGERVVLQGVLAGLGGADLDKNDVYGGGLKYIDGCPPASYDPHARAALLDEWGVDKTLLFPTICILPFPTDDQELANAYFRAYNNWMAEFHQAVPERTLPVAMVNWHDVDEAVKELQRCLKMGFKALFVPPETIDGRRLADPHFDPLWAICQDTGIPACLHVVVRFEGSAIPFVHWHTTSPGPLFSFSLGAPGQLMPAITSMVTDLLFERFPGLKVVSVEGGCGYAPYLMDRMDAKYEAFADIVTMQRKPSEYIRENFYFVAEPREQTVGEVKRILGEDRVLWGSDYPHVDAVGYGIYAESDQVWPFTHG